MSGNRYFKEIAWVSTVVYSIIYGVLEYFAFHSPNYNGALKISKYFPNMYFYWTFMLLTAVGITFVFCRNWISVFWSMWLFPVIEDLVFFIALAIHQHRFPFPVSNWYDDAFLIAKFTRLGQATLFWPFVPRFYYILPLIYLLGRFIPIFGSKMKNFLK
jgi:hypothetical protein